MNEGPRYRYRARRYGLDAKYFVRIAATNAGALPEWAREVSGRLAAENATRAFHWARLALSAYERGSK